MKKIVTRANGLPAYVSAKPRLRQSHFDAIRQIPERYRELKAEQDALDDAAGLPRDVGITKGAVWLCAILFCLAAWGALFYSLGIF